MLGRGPLTWARSEALPVSPHGRQWSGPLAWASRPEKSPCFWAAVGTVLRLEDGSSYRILSKEKKKKVLFLPSCTLGILTGPPRVAPKR